MINNRFALMALELVDLGVLIDGITIKVGGGHFLEHATFLGPKTVPNARHYKADLSRNKATDKPIDTDRKITM